VKAFKFLCDGVKSGKFRPDSKICTQVLSACSRDNRVDDGMGKQVLDWMTINGCRPDTVCYNSVITRYSKVPSMDGAHKAMELFNALGSAGLEPSGVTFSIMIDACKDDSGYLVELFDICTEAGLLDHKVATAFREKGPPNVQKQLKNSHSQWSRNAHRGPTGMSRKQIQQKEKKSGKSTGKKVDDYGW
jgi:hypothetical protein